MTLANGGSRGRIHATPRAVFRSDQAACLMLYVIRTKMLRRSNRVLLGAGPSPSNRPGELKLVPTAGGRVGPN